MTSVANAYSYYDEYGLYSPNPAQSMLPPLPQHGQAFNPYGYGQYPPQMYSQGSFTQPPMYPSPHQKNSFTYSQQQIPQLGQQQTGMTPRSSQYTLQQSTMKPPPTAHVGKHRESMNFPAGTLKEMKETIKVRLVILYKTQSNNHSCSKPRSRNWKNSSRSKTRKLLN